MLSIYYETTEVQALIPYELMTDLSFTMPCSLPVAAVCARQKRLNGDNPLNYAFFCLDFESRGAISKAKYYSCQ